MLVAPGMVYLHLPRTGGTFVSTVLETNGIGMRPVMEGWTGHEGVRELPRTTTDRNFVFASIRDPWSWYCSVDAHFRSDRHFQGFLHGYFGKVVGFPEVLHGLTRPAAYGKVDLDRTVSHPGGKPIPRFARELSTANIGLYTWMILHMFCREPLERVPDVQQYLSQGDALWDIDAVIDIAHLREGLSLILQSLNLDVSGKAAHDINSRAVANKSAGHRGVLANGRPDPAHYSREAQQWVEESDGWALRRFGFDKPAKERSALIFL
jgi:hypothetical protein